jgi:hypothetical protein
VTLYVEIGYFIGFRYAVGLRPDGKGVRGFGHCLHDAIEDLASWHDGRHILCPAINPAIIRDARITQRKIEFVRWHE